MENTQWLTKGGHNISNGQAHATLFISLSLMHFSRCDIDSRFAAILQYYIQSSINFIFTQASVVVLHIRDSDQKKSLS